MTQILDQNAVAERPQNSAAEAGRFSFSPELVTLHEGRVREAEAIRTVRTHVIVRHLENGKRGIAICSPNVDAGCTFTATNLAVSLAQVGVRTLLVDADLRAPGVDKLIRPTSTVPGLLQAIQIEEGASREVIQHEVVPNLSVLFAGGASNVAQELLARDKFRQLIDRCLRDFDFTIVDCPPADRWADGRRISAVVGYAVLVARAHSTRIPALSKLAKELTGDGAEVVGTVLNEVSR